MDFDMSYDRSGYRAILRDKASLITAGIDAQSRIQVTGEIDRIVVMGMGGSGLAARLLDQYLPLKIDLVQEYSTSIPLTSKTLLFICSYSGNTEEALAFFSAYSVTNAKVVVLTSGGQLRKNAQAKNIPVALMPKDLPPRTAAISMFFSMLKLIERAGLIEDQTSAIETVMRSLSNEDAQVSMEQYARNLASKLGDTVPLIYATQRLEQIGYYWKISFNETGKTHSFMHTIPELCHNELNAHRSRGQYYVIFLIDERDSKRLKERTDALRSVLNDRGIETSTLLIKGQTELSKMFHAVHLGELTSYYLALLKKHDPMETDVIEQFKKELSKKLFM